MSSNKAIIHLPVHHQLSGPILNLFTAEIKFFNSKSIFLKHGCQELIWKVESTLEKQGNAFKLLVKNFLTF